MTASCRRPPEPPANRPFIRYSSAGNQPLLGCIDIQGSGVARAGFRPWRGEKRKAVSTTVEHFRQSRGWNPPRPAGTWPKSAISASRSLDDGQHRLRLRSWNWPILPHIALQTWMSMQP